MVRFFTPGAPTTQGSKRAWVNKFTGKAQMQEVGGDRLRLWRHSVNNEARRLAEAGHYFEGPLSVSISFLLRKPKAAPKRKPTYPIGKMSGDIDKLSRAILDALSSVLFEDDSQVTKLTATKEFGEPIGAWVTVENAS